MSAVLPHCPSPAGRTVGLHLQNISEQAGWDSEGRAISKQAEEAEVGFTTAQLLKAEYPGCPWDKTAVWSCLVLSIRPKRLRRCEKMPTLMYLCLCLRPSWTSCGGVRLLSDAKAFVLWLAAVDSSWPKIDVTAGFAVPQREHNGTLLESSIWYIRVYQKPLTPARCVKCLNV